MSVSTTREDSGIRIAGDGVGVVLSPLASGEVSVSAIGYPPVTGFDRACRFGIAEDLPYPSRDQIQVVGDLLICMGSARYMTTARYREGFMLDLDPGMGPVVVDVIPRIFQIAEVAAHLLQQAEQLTRRQPTYQEAESVLRTVAATVLDGDDYPARLRAELACMNIPAKDSDMDLLDPLTTPAMLALVDKVGRQAG